MRPEPEVEVELELELDFELEVLEVTDEDCWEEVAEEVFVDEEFEVSEVESCVVDLEVELPEDVEVVVFWDEVTT